MDEECNVTESTAILDTAKLRQCLNSGSFDLNFLAFSGIAAPTLSFVLSPPPSESGYECASICYSSKRDMMRELFAQSASI